MLPSRAPAAHWARRAGDEREENIQRGHQLLPGNLLGVVHIRYVDSGSLKPDVN